MINWYGLVSKDLGKLPDCIDYYMKQQQAHWLHTEVPMMSDVNDWKQNLTDTEKNIIGSILKGFAQTECANLGLML